MSVSSSSNSYGLALGRVTGVRHHLELPVVRILWPQARAHLSLQLMPWACFEASPLIAAAFSLLSSCSIVVTHCPTFWSAAPPVSEQRQ